MKRVLIYIVAVIAIFACKSDPCMKSSGKMTEETRAFSDQVNTIDLHDNLGLDIYIDTANYIIVRGGENVVPFIETKDDGTFLTIKNGNSCKWLRDFDNSIRLELHIGNFNVLKHNGSKEVIMHDTLVTDKFRFECPDGAGNVQLLVHADDAYFKLGGLARFQTDGVANYAQFDIEGSGRFFGDGFSTNFTTVNHRGTGDCEIRVNNILDCKIDAIGNVIYYGRPDIQLESNDGKGRLIFGGM